MAIKPRRGSTTYMDQRDYKDVTGRTKPFLRSHMTDVINKLYCIANKKSYSYFYDNIHVLATLE